MSKYQLAQAILKLSESPTWDLARQEWQLVQIEETDDVQTCLCGHFPIKELCILQNKLNSKVTTVGNCCVKRFLGLPSNKIFTAVKRVRKDTQKSLNAETIKMAHERGWIDNWQKDFYLDIMRKRSLTDRQRVKKHQINEKILQRVRKTGGG